MNVMFPDSAPCKKLLLSFRFALKLYATEFVLCFNGRVSRNVMHHGTKNNHFIVWVYPSFTNILGGGGQIFLPGLLKAYWLGRIDR
jgi:hypothetical protein